MKILANDGISQAGVNALTTDGFEVITVNIAQEQLIEYINSNEIVGLLVRRRNQLLQKLWTYLRNLKNLIITIVFCL